MSENPFSKSLETGKNTASDTDAEQAAQAALGEDEADMSRLNIRIPEPLHEAFKQKCEAEARQMSALMRRWIREYVREDE
jgi:predicted DNA binding CopG/RHH family protein